MDDQMRMNMEYLKAKATLQHAFDHQSTISISKLKRLMNDLNMTPVDLKEMKFLKIEVKRLHKHIRKLHKKLGEREGN